MKTKLPPNNRLFVDQPIPGETKSDLLQYADQVDREGWIDTSLQLGLALCLAGSLLICGLRTVGSGAGAPVDLNAAAARPPRREKIRWRPAAPAGHPRRRPPRRATGSGGDGRHRGAVEASPGASTVRLDTLLQDIRHAVRMWSKNPGFAVLCILVLALGIGANTTIFSLVSAALLRRLPYPDADRMVWVWNQYPKSRLPKAGVSIPDYLDRRAQAEAFAESALLRPGSYNLGAGGGAAPERVLGLAVTPSFFAVLGISPRLGRRLRGRRGAAGRGRRRRVERCAVEEAITAPIRRSSAGTCR